MANTGNTQQIIDYGAAPNDGTGDPLRTAFIKTDENFSNIWAAGPVGSNITIANNTIQNDSTNGNIILKPNGTGVIQANAHILPSIDGVRDLGSNTRTWRRAYIDIMETQDLTLTGNLDVAGDATIQGNLTVEGDTIQIGNITTDTLLIQLANAAVTANAANGAGMTVGANDNIASMLYNSTSNTWNMNIGVSATGNITAPYFIGDGSQLTGMYGNANVVANLAALSTNPISTAGNITTNRLTGNAAVLTGVNSRGEHAANLGAPGFTELNANVVVQITGNANTYTQVNFQNINNGTRATTDYIATSSAGTDSTYYVDMGIASNSYDGSAPDNSLGNALYAQDSYLYSQGGNSVGGTGGNLVVGSNEPGGVVRIIADGSFTDNIVATFSNTGIEVKGNITPITSNLYSLGNATNWWSNLWVANNTIYIGGVALGITAGNVLTVGGNAVLQNNSNTSISTTGNITADYFIGDGSQLTGMYGNANVASYLPTYTGNLAGSKLAITSGANSWIMQDASLGAPSGGQWRSEVGSLDDYITSAANGYINLQSLYADGNIASELHLEHGLVHIRVADGPFNDWYFLTSGTLETPGDIIPQANGSYSLGNSTNYWSNLWVANNTIYIGGVPLGIGPGNVLTVGGNAVLQNDSNTSISTTGNITADYFFGDGSQLTGLNTDSISNGTSNVEVTTANGVVTLTTAGAYTWTFGTDGNLTLPSEGNIVGTTPNNSGSLQWIGASSGDGYGYTTMVLRPDITVGTDQAIVIDPTAPNHIHIRAGGTQDDSAASLFLGGENSAFVVPAGQNPPLYVTANSNTWTFGADSVLSAPGDISTTGNVTADYFIGDGSQLTGLPAQYGDANVATFLADFGSNAISTSGNVTAGNFVGSGTDVEIVAGSYTSTFDNAGNLTIPGNLVVTSGIVGSGASPAPSLSGFSTLSAQSISLSGTGTAVNASSGNILTNRVTGTQFAFLNGIYTAVLTGAGATGNYTLNLPDNAGSNGQSLTSDGTGNLVWSTPASSYGNANVATFLASYGSNTISTSGNVTAGNLIGNISITGNVTGTSANVTLVAGSYSWTFDNGGILTLPGGSGGGNEGGEIAFTQAANSTLAGNTVVLDQYVDRIRFFEGGGNARGVYIDLAKAPDGVGGELQFKASSLVNAGVDVTLGNLRARIPTSGNRSLQIATVSGTYSVYGSSIYNAGGTIGGTNITDLSPLSVTTTPAYLNAVNNFASGGDSGSWTIMDTTAGLAWRISFVIGASYNNNMITIERLV